MYHPAEPIDLISCLIIYLINYFFANLYREVLRRIDTHTFIIMIIKEYLKIKRFEKKNLQYYNLRICFIKFCWTFRIWALNGIYCSVRNIGDFISYLAFFRLFICESFKSIYRVRRIWKIYRRIEAHFLIFLKLSSQFIVVFGIFSTVVYIFGLTGSLFFSFF